MHLLTVIGRSTCIRIDFVKKNYSGNRQLNHVGSTKPIRYRLKATTLTDKSIAQTHYLTKKNKASLLFSVAQPRNTKLETRFACPLQPSVLVMVCKGRAPYSP